MGYIKPFVNNGKNYQPQLSRVFFYCTGPIHWHGGYAEGSAGLPFVETSATRAYAGYICLRETPPRGIAQGPFSFIYGAAAVDEEELDEPVLDDEEGWARRLCVWHTNRTGSF